MPTRSTAAVSAFAVFLLASTASRAGQGADAYWIPRAVLVQGSSGNSIFVHASNASEILGWAVALRYDPAALSVAAVGIEGTDAEAEVNPGFSGGTIDPVKGVISHGVVVDIATPPRRTLPAGPDRTVLRVDVTAIGAPATTSLSFRDDLQSHPPLRNAFTDPLLASRTVPGTDGTVVIVDPGYFPPVADAGPPVTGAGGSPAVLDGSHSRWAPGRTPSFQWDQVGGPPATPLSGGNAATSHWALPAVSGDTGLVFRLTVDDGLFSSEATVSVEAVDASLRRGTASAAPNASPALLDGGARALVFAGQLQWEPGPEDGEWTGIRFRPSGAGDASRLLTGLSLYIDADGDGKFGPADRLVGTAAIPAGGAPVGFALRETIPSGSSRTYFAVADVAGKATASSLVLPVLLGGLGAGLLARSRRRSRGRRSRPGRAILLAVLLAGLASLPSACGGGGGSHSASTPVTPPSRQVRFDVGLTDIAVRGASTKVEGSVSGLPLQGQPIDV